jgi:hypothetical protein
MKLNLFKNKTANLIAGVVVTKGVEMLISKMKKNK